MATDQLRTFLIIALCMVSFLIYTAWQEQFSPKPAVTTTADPEVPADVPTTSSAPTAPATTVSTDVPTASGQAGSVPETSATSTPGDLVTVTTDLVEVDIDLAGGTLSRLKLLEYPATKDSDVPFDLLKNTPEDVFIAQSGLRGRPDAPDHHEPFRTAARAYALGDNDAVRIPLTWTGSDGLKVTKVFTFKRGSYAIDVRYLVENTGSTAWSGDMYAQFQRMPPVKEGGGMFRADYTYTGGVVSTPDKPYDKFDFGKMNESNLELHVKGGWIAMIQHYFAGAWVPDQTADVGYYTQKSGANRYNIGLLSAKQTVAPGSQGEFGLTLYLGPKIQDRLEKVAPHLERTVDFGWLWFIAEPLFWLLDKIHSVIGNWGWSIIVLTIIIKLVFFHLSATSYKSMARMRKLQPKVQTLRDRYGEDKQRMNQAMMELYKKEKINPLGGCLPILVQIPVFIALYWTLLESVELRQAPFALWINDLSVHDPFFVLPLAMGGSMWIQQKLNPAPPDPMQAKIMMMLPIIFTVFFLFFPSGLVLYWLVNNVLSIIQQWVITKKIVGEK